MGSSSKWWLKNSLKSLDKSINGNLVLVNGDTKSLIQKLVDKYNISAICWNARYSQNEIQLDNDIEKSLNNHGVNVNIFHSTLLKNPKITLKKDGTPFKVYTPFYKQKYSALKYESYDYDSKALKYVLTSNKKDNNSLIDKIFPDENWHRKLNEFWTFLKIFFCKF